MQICALDSSLTLIFAQNADKRKDYQCIECNQTIRLRGGIHRQAHFYHVQPNRTCKQHGKGMPHLMLQHFIKNLIPDGEVELECRFPLIGRIADVAWHSKSLIFEIQCSPISLEEVKNRNKNYASIGYQVVWIFHDSLYNKHRLSSAEDFLRGEPHYFTNMNEEGEGGIYDQFSLITDRKRIHRLPALPINLSFPKSLSSNSSGLWIASKPRGWINRSQVYIKNMDLAAIFHPRELSRDSRDLFNLKTGSKSPFSNSSGFWTTSKKKLPFILQRRADSWPVFFSGDTIDTYTFASTDLNEAQKMLFADLNSLEGKKKLSFFDFFKKTQANVYKNVARLYGSILKLILERACR